MAESTGRQRLTLPRGSRYGGGAASGCAIALLLHTTFCDLDGLVIEKGYHRTPLLADFALFDIGDAGDDDLRDHLIGWGFAHHPHISPAPDGIAYNGAISIATMTAISSAS